MQDRALRSVASTHITRANDYSETRTSINDAIPPLAIVDGASRESTLSVTDVTGRTGVLVARTCRISARASHHARPLVSTATVCSLLLGQVAGFAATAWGHCYQCQHVVVDLVVIGVGAALVGDRQRVRRGDGVSAGGLPVRSGRGCGIPALVGKPCGQLCDLAGAERAATRPRPLAVSSPDPSCSRCSPTVLRRCRCRQDDIHT